MNVEENWKSKALVTGALLGTIAGIGAAYMFIQRAEKEDTRLEMTAGEGVKLGLLVLGMLRQVAQLGE